MKSIAEILNSQLKKHQLLTSAMSAIILARVNKYIFDHMGKQASKNIVCKTYENNIIHVEITHSTWAQEFQLNKLSILQTLRTEFPDKSILDFKIQITGV